MTWEKLWRFFRSSDARLGVLSASSAVPSAPSRGDTLAKYLPWVGIRGGGRLATPTTQARARADTALADIEGLVKLRRR